MNYRVILQAEGQSRHGDWFGLYAARDVSAADGAEAARLAATQLQANWDGTTLGKLLSADAIAIWRAPVLRLKRAATGGQTFYNDDLDAQREALRIEAKANGLPKPALDDLLRGLT